MLSLRSCTALATMGVGLMIGTAAHAQQSPPAPAPVPQEPTPTPPIAQQPATPPEAPAAPATPPNGEEPAAPPNGEEPAAPPNGEEPAAPPTAQQPAPPTTPLEASSAPAAPPAETVDATQLQAIVVKAERITELDQAKAKQQEIVGSTSIVTSGEVNKGRKATVADVLQKQPGVYVEQVGGSDAVKVSIRGSGINNGPGFFRQGVIFLFDGLSITGPGGTSYEMLNAQGLDYAEVLNGGNAFEYGALGIGGAVNFHTQSGLTTPGLNLRLERGSFGYQRETASYGGQIGRFDYYVNLSNYRNSGYQDYALAKSRGAVVNLGYRFSDKLSTRFIAHYAKEWHQTNGALTGQELASDPRQFGGTVKSGAGSERPGAYWIGNITTYHFDDGSQLDAGLAYYRYEHINGRNGTGPGWWDWQDLNASVRYSRDDSWWGHEAKSYVAFNQTQHLGTAEVRGYQQPLWTDKGGPNTDWRRFSWSWNRVLSAGLDLALIPDLWLTAGLGLVDIRRNIVIEFDNRYPISGDDRADFRHRKLAPRIGLRYALTPQAGVFSNYTRSYDPESDWNYITTAPTRVGDTTVTNRYIKRQVPQESDTFEVGVKGQWGILDGSLALYRASIRHELLTVQVLPLGWDGNPDTPALNTTFNSPTPTVHQGIELGINARLWEGGKGNGVVFNQSYTFNDFHYLGSPEYGDNALPGQPRHIYNGEIQLQLAGFYVGPNVRAVSKIPVDYANSLYSASYALLGAKAGYASPDNKWSVYVDARNLGNVHHANAVAITGTASTDPASQRYFYAGDGRGLYVGVSSHTF